MSVNDTQHGGTHYRTGYQHWDLVADLGLNYFQANATKYVSRHRKKNGREDLAKAGHYIDKWNSLMDERRLPMPAAPHHLMDIARAELLNRFFDGNGIESGPEMDFFVAVCLPLGPHFIRKAKHALAEILREYDADEEASKPTRAYVDQARD